MVATTQHKTRMIERRKHYIIFSALFHPSVGGVESFTKEIAHRLIATGHLVTVVTQRISDDPIRSKQDGLCILRLPCIPLLGGRLPLPRPSLRGRTLWKELEQSPCDGVLVNTRFYPLSVMGVRFARNRGVTPLVLEHGSAHLTFGNTVLDMAAQSYEHAVTALLKRSRPRFYAVSEQGLAWLEHFHIRGISILPNAIDAAAFRSNRSARSFRAELGIQPDELVIAFVGRLVPEKGITQLVEAARILVARGVAIKLLVAGDGPLRKALEQNLPPNTYLLGTLAAPLIASLLTEANLFCLPSRSEGFAISLLEAAACETPPLVTAVGIACNLVPDERFGTILPSTEPAVLATAIASLAARPELLRSQGKAIRKRAAERYSWDATTRLLIKAFDEAAQDVYTAMIPSDGR